MTDRSKKPTQRGHSGPVEVPATFEDDAPTTVDPAARFPRADSPPIQVVSMKTPHESGPIAISMKTPHESGPIAISMKTPMDQAAADGPAQTPIVKRPKLRAISEITPLPHAQPRNLGYLAPPRDPAEVRSRRVRDLVMWSSMAVIVASVVALVIWFVAR
jgi:hypothetical protein